jgi:hypothetical protein
VPDLHVDLRCRRCRVQPRSGRANRILHVERLREPSHLQREDAPQSQHGSVEKRGAHWLHRHRPRDSGFYWRRLLVPAAWQCDDHPRTSDTPRVRVAYFQTSTFALQLFKTSTFKILPPISNFPTFTSKP